MDVNHRKVRIIRRSDLARLTGCNLETIRYYESIGVMPEPPRTSTNYRAYDDSHVARLRFVMRSRDLGFTLEEIRDLLGLGDGGLHTCAEVKQKTEAHLAEVRAKIADLRRVETVLSATAARCSGGEAPDCAIIDLLRGL